MNVIEEINQFSSEEDKPALLWLFSKYHQYWYGSLLNGLASQVISDELGISPIPIHSLMNDYGVRVSAEVITNCLMRECIEFGESETQNPP